MSPEAFPVGSHRLKTEVVSEDNRIRDVWLDNFFKELE